MGFVTSAAVAAWIGVSDDATVQTLTKVAEAMIGKFCGGRTFTLAERTEYPRGRGRCEFVAGAWRSWLFMREWPITSIAGIWIDAAGVFGADTAIDVADALVEGNRIILPYDVPEGSRVAKVTYTAGFDVTSNVPAEAEDLVYAIKQQAAILYRQGSSERMQSESMGAYSYTRMGGESPLGSIDPTVAQILRPYRA